MESHISQDMVNRLNLLLEINASINSTRNLDELLNKITNVTSVVMRSEASSIALLDEETNELIFRFVHGSVSDIVKTIRVPVGQGISGWVAKYGVPVIVPDAQKDPRFNHSVDDKTSFVTKSVICVPLKIEDKVTGILQSLNKKDGSTFSNDDLAIFESLASIAAIAIENAQLYDLLNQRLAQIEEQKQRNEYILEQLKRSEEETEKLKEMSKKGDFSGKLDIFRVENLVQMLSNDYKTGRLTLRCVDEEAHIFLQDGKLRHAEIKKRSIRGLSAFYETICWLDGTFIFEDGIRQDQNTIDKMSMSIIIEGLRRLDESNVLKEKYPPAFIPKYTFELTYSLAPNPNDPPKTVILNGINGIKNVGEILKEVPFDRYTILSSLKELEEEKMITFHE